MLDVLNDFMKNLFTVKSSDCNTLLTRLQTSRAYRRIGQLMSTYIHVVHACAQNLGLRIYVYDNQKSFIYQTNMVEE